MLVCNPISVATTGLCCDDDECLHNPTLRISLISLDPACPPTDPSGAFVVGSVREFTPDVDPCIVCSCPLPANIGTEDGTHLNGASYYQATLLNGNTGGVILGPIQFQLSSDVDYSTILDDVCGGIQLSFFKGAGGTPEAVDLFCEQVGECLEPLIVTVNGIPVGNYVPTEGATIDITLPPASTPPVDHLGVVVDTVRTYDRPQHWVVSSSEEVPYAFTELDDPTTSTQQDLLLPAPLTFTNGPCPAILQSDVDVNIIQINMPNTEPGRGIMQGRFTQNLSGSFKVMNWYHGPHPITDLSPPVGIIGSGDSYTMSTNSVALAPGQSAFSLVKVTAAGNPDNFGPKAFFAGSTPVVCQELSITEV